MKAYDGVGNYTPAGRVNFRRSCRLLSFLNVVPSQLFVSDAWRLVFGIPVAWLGFLVIIRRVGRGEKEKLLVGFSAIIIFIVNHLGTIGLV